MDFNDVIAGRANSPYVASFDKPGGSLSGNRVYSSFRLTGNPAAGTTPTTTFAVCTSSTTGAVPLPSLGSGSYYLDRLSLTLQDSWAQRHGLHDRLAHVGGYSGTSTGTQSFAVSVTGAAAARIGASDYSEVSWFLEWYVATGATPTTAVVTYTNGAGTGSRTTNVDIPASIAADRMIRIIGDAGEPIQSIQSVQLTPSTGTTGNFGLTATREVCVATSSILIGTAQPKNWAQISLPKVAADSCLFFIMFTQGVSNNSIAGRLHFFSSTAS